MCKGDFCGCEKYSLFGGHRTNQSPLSTHKKNNQTRIIFSTSRISLFTKLKHKIKQILFSLISKKLKKTLGSWWYTSCFSPRPLYHPYYILKRHIEYHHQARQCRYLYMAQIHIQRKMLFPHLKIGRVNFILPSPLFFFWEQIYCLD